MKFSLIKNNNSSLVSGLSFNNVFWVGFQRVSLRFVAFARIAILARILVPAQFGIFGIASLSLALLEVLTETGINVFLIQEKKAFDYINSAWIVSMVRGAIIFLVILTSASFVSMFFSSPESTRLLVIISIVPLIKGFINPSIIKFQKSLLFKLEFSFRLSIFVVESVVAIAVSFVMKSPEGLVWGFVVGALLEVFLSNFFIKPKPKFVFEWVKIKKIISRGKWVTGYGILEYSFREGDDVVVGKLLGEGPLGIYQVAYKISSLPITEVGNTISRIVFPAYSRLKDTTQMIHNFKKVFTISVLASFFMALLIFLFSEEIVMFLLGPNWLEAIVLLRALSIFGLLKTISTSVFPLYLALGKQEYVAKVNLFSTLSMFILIFPLIDNFGIMGAVYSVIFSTALTLPLNTLVYWRVKSQTNMGLTSGTGNG